MNRRGNDTLFLSFIVPVYNVERFLPACLDSLLHQDIPADVYEIICVNDGATDASPAILRQYEASHGNLRVIHQENSGVCAARNAGLAQAKGDYIWFIDADDCIRPDCLAMLRQALTGSGADRIDRMVIDNYSFPETADPYTCESKKRNTIWHDSSACKSVFRKQFLVEHDLRFRYPELIYGEDALFMYEVKYEKPHTIFSGEPLYYCRERSGSASRENTEAAERKRLRSTIREAEIMKRYYEGGRTDQITADRLMSYLYGALYHIAAMPRREARQELERLRAAQLFPFRRPPLCSIHKSYYVNRGDFVERIHEWIYCRINSRLGYCAMRCWNAVFRMKGRLLHRKNTEK